MENPSFTRDIKLIPIGNSQGVRLPKAVLQRYGFVDTLVMEETDRGILLRKKEEDRLSWEETYQEMAREQEGWDDFDITLLDGLEDDEPDS